MNSLERHTLTQQEHLEWEDLHGCRPGKGSDKTGVSSKHIQLSGNQFALVQSHLKDKTCHAYIFNINPCSFEVETYFSPVFKRDVI